MGWTYSRDHILFDAQKDEVLFQTPIQFDSTCFMPKFLKPQFLFNTTLNCPEPYRLILRSSSGLKRLYPYREFPADETDFFLLTDYASTALPTISDELAERTEVQADSYEELTKGSTIIRGWFDNLQYDVSNAFYEALQRAAYLSPNLTRESRGEISNLVKPLTSILLV